MAPGKSPVLVSVIIPTYNYGRFLKESLDSVLAQTLQDFEIIVVDDGSTDNTPEVLQSVSDARLRAIRISNSGVSTARNIGLKEAHGDFVAFLDADDRWRPTKLATQIALLTSEPSVGSVFTDFVRFNESGMIANEFSFYPELKTISTRPSARGGGMVLLGDPFCELISFSQFPAYVQTVLFRRELADGLLFPSNKPVSEDLYFLMKIYGRAQVAFIADPLADVRRHGTNTGGEKGGNSPIKQLTADIKALELLGEGEISPERRRAIRVRLGKLHSAMGHHYFWEKRPLPAAQAYLNCLAYPRNRLRALLHILALPLTLFVKSRPETD